MQVKIYVAMLPIAKLLHILYAKLIYSFIHSLSQMIESNIQTFNHLHLMEVLFVEFIEFIHDVWCFSLYLLQVL